MIVDHVGIVVRSLEPSIELWQRQFGYDQATDAVVNTRQRVRVVFLRKQGSLAVKLIEPTDERSPVFAFSRRGGGLHHLCFRTSDLRETILHLEETGGRTIVPPQPGEAFDDEPIAFVLAQPGLNVEIIATSRRRQRRT
jgi:methylmalonyl-CoA/ethylmalonyl-CoA epimerase